jgi:surface carbohydrate biosynthesis protein (TIGR04326 family)
MPQPDVMAINGPLARASLLTGGFPENRLRNVEALRFLHLQTFGEQGSITRAKMRPFCVLVFADFQSATNSRLLAWLKIALTELQIQTRVIIKPHPAFPLDDHIKTSLPSSLITLSTQPIHQLLSESNVVFASNTTSASIYALCAGVPVIQMMDCHGFNASPLRSVDGIQFVNSPYKLAEALLHARVSHLRPADLFNFNTHFRGWHNLIFSSI